MTLTELVNLSHLKATGKAFNGTQGDVKWEKIRNIANDLIDAWESEPGVDWFTLYDSDYALGTVTATNAYEMDTDEIRKISLERGDSIRIVHTDGNYTDYTLVEGDKLKNYTQGDYCARIGNELVFNKTFSSEDPQFGGAIQIPVYTYAEHLTSASSVVPVDIPRWLMVMTAAEYVRNDIVRQNQYPNLVTEANQMMGKMVENNDAQIDSVTRIFVADGISWA